MNVERKPKTEKQERNSFLRELWRNYSTDPEARKFLVRLGKKQKHNRSLRKILGTA